MDRRRGSLVPSIHKAVEDSLRANSVAFEEPEEHHHHHRKNHDSDRNKKRKKKTRSSSASEADVSMTTAPRHVQKFDWKDMLNLADISGRKRGNSTASHSGHATRAGSMKGKSWLEGHLKMRQCSHFVPTQRFSERCGCGKEKSRHSEEILEKSIIRPSHLTLPGMAENDADQSEQAAPGRWSIKDHTELLPTDTYGSLIFEGTTHHVQYARVSFDTEPKDIVHLMMKIWKLRPPKLIITINGGLTKFDLQPKLARTFRKGIMKIAKSTDAWIITSGLDEGVVKHLASALQDHNSSHHTKNHVVSIGIASWGMLKQRNRFVGRDQSLTYSPNIYNNSRLKELNDKHSYFLFADNGTVNRYGAEIILRKRLETHLAQGDRKRGAIPLVCVVLEGGAFTIKMVHDYVTTIPRIPVIVCDGSGRASDILAFAHQTVSQSGYLSENVQNQLTNIIRKIFGYDTKTAQKLLKQVIDCATNKSLMTIFRLGESQREDLDHAIMSCLLKGQNMSPPEQLQLALAWNRADIARTEIFAATGTEWTTQDLHNAMIEALSNDRLDFVQLLLENGVSMQKFLTYGRLEHLYNSDKGPQNTLRSNLLVDNRHHIKLGEIGRLVEHLMGNLYKSNYTKEEFKNQYYLFSNRRHFGNRVHTTNGRNEVVGPNGAEGRDRMSSMQINLLNNARNSIISLFGAGPKKADSEDDEFSNIEEEDSLDFTFRYPYSELMVWAVLTKRQDMAKLLWKHGEEGMAKALVASRLYMSLGQTASLTTGEIGMSQDFTEFSDEFSDLAVEVLEYCTKHSREMTLQLLTCELENWGGETCLSLAANNGHRQFLAHPCCQMLLSDLWQGGLLMKSNPNAKVLTCLAAPPLIFLLGFKTKEQLMLQPKTALENEEENESDVSSMDGETDESTSSEEENEEEGVKHRAQSFGADQPLSIQKLVRDKLNISEKHKKTANDFGISRIVVAPPIVESRTRSRTMSVKKSKKKKNVVTPPACLQIDNSDDDDEEEQRKAAAKYLNRTAKRGSTAVRIHDDDMYIDPSEDIETAKKTSEEFDSSRQETIQVLTQRPLSWKRKILEFYRAPITTYWLWFFAFIVFLVMLTYNILVKTQRVASWSEWYVFIYVLVWCIEICRKVVSMVMMDTSKPVLKQLRVYFLQYRNGTLAVGLVTFLIAYFIRLSPQTRTLGRILIICNSVIWSLKLVDYLSVQPTLGPYISMVAEMIPPMIPLCVLVFITLFAFGLLQQGIKYPYEDWHWILIRNIFLHPYFMLYGEVYAAEIDTCGDEIWDTHEDNNIPISMLNVTHETCVPGYWIAPVGLTVFMLATNVLLMNVMVASCTYIFEKYVDSTRELFLFDRYRQVIEYDSTPWLPPPFTIIYHIMWCLKLVKNRATIFERKNLFDASLKLFLSPDEMERVHAFEEESVEDMKRETEQKSMRSNEERIYRTAERTDIILHRVSNLTTMEVTLKDEIRELEHRLKTMEKGHRDQVSILLDMNRKLSQLISGGSLNQPIGGGQNVPVISVIEEEEPVKHEEIPMITIDGPSPSTSRRTSGQYVKRDSLKFKKPTKPPRLVLDEVESNDSDNETISIPVPSIRVRQVTESERSDLSDEDLVSHDITHHSAHHHQQLQHQRAPRRHALYSTLVDTIDTDDFYTAGPTPVTPVQPDDGTFFGENSDFEM